MKKYQTGAAAVEFALVAILFLTILLSIMDFGRILYTWNSAGEATRAGARMAVVCDKADAAVLTEMQKFVPIQQGNMEINWYVNNSVSNSCNSATCTGVAVSIKNLTITPVSPLTWIGFSSLTVPGFSTYLPREIMGQDPNSNTVCS